jgi:hypothetical protein
MHNPVPCCCLREAFNGSKPITADLIRSPETGHVHVKAGTQARTENGTSMLGWNFHWYVYDVEDQGLFALSVNGVLSFYGWVLTSNAPAGQVTGD